MQKWAIYSILLVFLACEYRVQVGEPQAVQEDASAPVTSQSDSGAGDASIPDAGQLDASIPQPECDPSKVRFGNDGCPKNALCQQVKTDGGVRAYCRTFNACPESDWCPQYTFGSVCNDGFIPNKDRICIDGACEGGSDCPVYFNCIKWNSADVLGVCSDGASGAPCLKHSQCGSRACLDAGSGRGECQ